MVISSFYSFLPFHVDPVTFKFPSMNASCLPHTMLPVTFWEDTGYETSSAFPACWAPAPSFQVTLCGPWACPASLSRTCEYNKPFNFSFLSGIISTATLVWSLKTAEEWGGLLSHLRQSYECECVRVCANNHEFVPLIPIQQSEFVLASFFSLFVTSFSDGEKLCHYLYYIYLLEPNIYIYTRRSFKIANPYPCGKMTN